MTGVEVARVALKYFPEIPISTPQGSYTLPVVMVAIAKGESSFNERASGDCKPQYQPQCNGCSSFGLWQIHVPAHYPYLQLQTRSSNPCVWRNWLFNPDNNAKAARHVYDSQGLGAWTVWKTDEYLDYLVIAKSAVDTAKQEQEGLVPSPFPPPFDFIPLAGAVLIAVGLAITGAVLIGAGMGSR